MLRMVKDARIETRAARARIAVADSVRSKEHEPHWRAIGECEHLGYRKGKHGSKWIARYRKDGAYVKKLLGKADDAREADGASVLDYRQDAASAWFAAEARASRGLDPKTGAPKRYTVDAAARAAAKESNSEALYGCQLAPLTAVNLPSMPGISGAPEDIFVRISSTVFRKATVRYGVAG